MEPKKRRTRYDKGSIRITERDIAVTRWIGEQYAIRQDQLSLLLGVDLRPARKWVDRMRRQRWLQSQIFKGELWIWATAQGLRDCELPYPPQPPITTQLALLYNVNQVRLWYARRRANVTWVSGRNLAQQAEPDHPWLRFIQAAIHRDGESGAILVGLSARDKARTRQLVLQLLDGGYSVEYYVAPNALAHVQHVRRSLLDRFEDQVLSRKLQIIDLASIHGELATIAQQASAERKGKEPPSDDSQNASST